MAQSLPSHNTLLASHHASTACLKVCHLKDTVRIQMTSKAVLQDITNVTTCRNILNKYWLQCAGAAELVWYAPCIHVGDLVPLPSPFETSIYSAVWIPHIYHNTFRSNISWHLILQLPWILYDCSVLWRNFSCSFMLKILHQASISITFKAWF